MTSSERHGREGPPTVPLSAWANGEGAGLLKSFESALRELPQASPAIRDIIRPVLGSGAKRLRPCLVLVSGSFGQPPRDALVATAVAVEFVHTASLLHDDVIDQSAFRRGVPALHRVHGPRAAVFVGFPTSLTSSANWRTRHAKAPSCCPATRPG